MTDQTTTGQRHWAATTVGVLAVVTALASLIMALAHMGIEIPVLMEDAIVLPPVAAGFGVAVVVSLVVAFGAFRVATWGWLTGLVVFGLAVLVILGSPARNWVSWTVLVASVLALMVLVSPYGRAAFGRS